MITIAHPHTVLHHVKKNNVLSVEEGDGIPRVAHPHMEIWKRNIAQYAKGVWLPLIAMTNVLHVEVRAIHTDDYQLLLTLSYYGL